MTQRVHIPLPGQRLPGDVIVPQIIPGMAPDSGVSPRYAREDHAHGTPVSGHGRVYYFTHSSASDIATYKVASSSEPSAAEQTVSQANTGTSDTLVATFATPSGDPNITLLPHGVVLRHFHASTGGLTQRARLKVAVYKRTDPGGVETLLRTGYSQEFSGDLQEVVWSQSFDTGDALASTNRLVFKVYTARVNGPTTCNVTLYFEGANNVSYVTTSILSVPAAAGSTPGGTVVSEVTPGQSSTPGVGTAYSRVDHTHGTPPGTGTRQTLTNTLVVDASTTVRDPVFATLLTQAITKMVLETTLYITFTASCSATARVRGARFRILVNGTPTDSTCDEVSGNQTNGSASIKLAVAALAAGPHTVVVQWAKSGSDVAGTSLQIFPVTNPNTDHASLELTEL